MASGSVHRRVEPRRPFLSIRSSLSASPDSARAWSIQPRRRSSRTSCRRWLRLFERIPTGMSSPRCPARTRSRSRYARRRSSTSRTRDAPTDRRRAIDTRSRASRSCSSASTSLPPSPARASRSRLPRGRQHPQRRQLVVRRAVISKYVDTPKQAAASSTSPPSSPRRERHLAASSTKVGRVFLQDSGLPAPLPSTSTCGPGGRDPEGGHPDKEGREAPTSCATWSAQPSQPSAGAPMIVIQSLAGHQSPRTPAVDAPGRLRSAAAALQPLRPGP